MKYISSDTNVWIDFAVIDRLSLPFRLPYTYLMNDEAISNEFLEPSGLGESLVKLGLQPTELTEEEFYLADELNTKYKRPSLFDCISLAIAKCRKLALLSGDGPLRKAAQQEGVEVIGTIGLLDELYDQKRIETAEYLYCLKALLQNNGDKVRLPENELKKRIDMHLYPADK